MIAHLIRRILSTLSQAGARILNPGGVRRGAARPRSVQDGRVGAARAPGPGPAPRPPAGPAALPRNGPAEDRAASLGGKAAHPQLAPGPAERPGVRGLPAARGCPPPSFPRSETQQVAEEKRPRRRPRTASAAARPAAPAVRRPCALLFSLPVFRNTLIKYFLQRSFVKKKKIQIEITKSLGLIENTELFETADPVLLTWPLSAKGV